KWWGGPPGPHGSPWTRRVLTGRIYWDYLSRPELVTQRKIARRLLPFLFLLYVTAFVDRVNVAFAGLQMTRELNFSNEVFGFGAGIFFFGYCLLEIPGAM